MPHDPSVKLEDKMEDRAIQVAKLRMDLEAKKKPFPTLQLIDALMGEGYGPLQAGAILNRAAYLAPTLEEARA